MRGCVQNFSRETLKETEWGWEDSIKMDFKEIWCYDGARMAQSV